MSFNTPLEGLGVTYSVLKLFTGLAIAAFTVWKVTVNIVISSTANADIRKGIGESPVLYENICSHLCMNIYAIGKATRQDIPTSTIKLVVINGTICPTP